MPQRSLNKMQRCMPSTIVTESQHFPSAIHAFGTQSRLLRQERLLVTQDSSREWTFVKRYPTCQRLILIIAWSCHLRERPPWLPVDSLPQWISLMDPHGELRKTCTLIWFAQSIATNSIKINHSTNFIWGILAIRSLKRSSSMTRSELYALSMAKSKQLRKQKAIIKMILIILFERELFKLNNKTYILTLYIRF